LKIQTETPAVSHEELRRFLEAFDFCIPTAAPKYLTRIGSTKSNTSAGLHKGHGAPSHRCASRGRERSHWLTSEAFDVACRPDTGVALS